MWWLIPVGGSLVGSVIALIRAATSESEREARGRWEETRRDVEKSVKKSRKSIEKHVTQAKKSYDLRVLVDDHYSFVQAADAAHKLLDDARSSLHGINKMIKVARERRTFLRDKLEEAIPGKNKALIHDVEQELEEILKTRQSFFNDRNKIEKQKASFLKEVQRLNNRMRKLRKLIQDRHGIKGLELCNRLEERTRKKRLLEKNILKDFDPTEGQRQEQAFVAKVRRKELSPSRVNNKGQTDLHIAVDLNLSVLIISLLRQGAAVNAKDSGGWTPLHYAAEHNARATASLLLAYEADVDVEDAEGRTPLHHAVANKAHATAKLLLAHEANVNAKTKEGWTPLHYAAEHNAHATVGLLLAYRADVNAKDNGDWTPLHYAAEHNARATASLLLDHGATVNARDEERRTPLHYAVENNAHAIVWLLLGHRVIVNARDEEGRTPLYYAARYRAHKSEELLHLYDAHY